MKKTIFLSLALLSSYPVFAAPEKLAPIPHLHPSVIQGQLPNGLRYLIKQIAPQAGQPSEVELRLLVNSGSLSETNDERGVAHLIEHMAFRQTKNFGKDEVKEFFNSNGMRWGQDSNAVTTHESTTYTFKVNSTAIDRGLLLMADWANGNIVFDPVELKAERQVVLNEMNFRQNETSNWREFYSILIPDSPHLENMPTGVEDNVRDLSPERVEALYRKLYQPQKMTLVVAGDVPKNIEQTIKTLFSRSPMGDQASQYPALPLTPKVRIYRGQAPAWPENELAVAWSFSLLPATDAKHEQLQIVGLIAMLQRLQKLATHEEQAFSSVRFGNNIGAIGGKQFLTLSAVVKDGKFSNALTQLYREVRRSRERGFSDAEVNDAIATITMAIKTMPISNQTWAESLLASAKEGTSPLYSAEPKALFDSDEITPQLVNAAWQHVVTTPDQIAILMGAPIGDAHQDFYSWHDEKLVEMMAAVDAETLQALVAYVEKPLLPKEPPRGKIVQTKTENGATVWVLSNGAQVLVRQQRQADERIGVNARFAGGALALPEEWRFVSKILPKYMAAAGAGNLTSNEMGQVVRNEDLQLEPMFETDQHGFVGLAAARSLTPLMQLIYLGLAQPRGDDVALKNALDQGYDRYWPNGPGFSQNLYGAAWPYGHWGRSDFSITTEQLEKLRQQLYGNPAQLRIVLTGVADMAQAKDLVERYIASIPIADSAVPLLLPSKITTRNLGLPAELSAHVKASLNTFTHFDNSYAIWGVALDSVESNTQNLFLQKGLSDVIKQRLISVLREQAGNSYFVNTEGELSPYYGFTLNISYSLLRDKCRQSIILPAQELRKISQNSVTDIELKSMRELMQKGLDDAPKNPYGYAYSQMFHWVNNQNLSWVNPKPEQILSRANVDAAAKNWFVPGKWIVAADACKTLPDLTELDHPVTAASKYN